LFHVARTVIDADHFASKTVGKKNGALAASARDIEYAHAWAKL
jgi:hypothetical protein